MTLAAAWLLLSLELAMYGDPIRAAAVARAAEDPDEWLAWAGNDITDRSEA